MTRPEAPFARRRDHLLRLLADVSIDYTPKVNDVVEVALSRRRRPFVAIVTELETDDTGKLVRVHVFGGPPRNVALRVVHPDMLRPSGPKPAQELR